MRADDSGAVWLENARDVAASWTGPKRLVVQYTGLRTIEGKVQRVGDVRVTYLAVDSIGATPVPTRDTTVPRPPRARLDRPQAANSGDRVFGPLCARRARECDDVGGADGMWPTTTAVCQ